MPKLVRRGGFQLTCAHTELLCPCQITLAEGGFCKLGGCESPQMRNALAGHSCFDSRNQRAPDHRALHPHEQRGALLFTANGRQPFWAADLLEIAGERALCF